MDGHCSYLTIELAKGGLVMVMASLFIPALEDPRLIVPDYPLSSVRQICPIEHLPDLPYRVSIRFTNPRFTHLHKVPYI